MPRIELIPEVLYSGLQPYHVEYDNLPLRNILARQTIMNLAIDLNADIIRDSVGAAGTLANRLAQSLNQNGSLKATALDAPQNASAVKTYQNIGAHQDGDFDDGTGVKTYVRMLEEERDKLSLIADGATDIVIEVETPSSIVALDAGTITLAPTSSIQLDLEAPSTIKFVTAFPASAAHQHFYDQTPAHAVPSSPDYQNYKVNTIATPFVEDTLRVYVNGIRLSETDSVYVPGPAGPDDVWTLTSYTASHGTGTFALSRAIDAADVIRIDYNTTF